MTASAETIERLKQAVGPDGSSDDASELKPHLTEWRGKYRGCTPLMLKPRTTAEIAAILSICNETRTPVVPQGGNTGLVGAQVPFNSEILLYLGRMNGIRNIDVDDMTAIAEAGVVLGEFQRAISDSGAYFPLSLAAEGSATLGGNLSTNAGGTNVLRYGSARQLVLGIEVVLADGRVLDLLRVLRKDNTGYDLKQLFIGAEGTLGVITAAALKLFPKPVNRETAFVAVRDANAAVELLRLLQNETGGLISAFELLPRIGLELVLAHIPHTRDPLATPSPWYVLVEAESASAIPLRAIVEHAFSAALHSGLVTDATLASSENQRDALWRLRESLSEAQKLDGASIKHDISIPVHAISAFLAQGTAAVQALIPQVRPVSFGHIGDGNIHFNFSAPKGGSDAQFLSRWEEVSRVVHDIAHGFGGSISAEHGIGVMKRDEIVRYKGAAELDVMRALKRTLDPNNILNPGKVLQV
jgi:FAD/FMN-containing dehydrogenase